MHSLYMIKYDNHHEKWFPSVFRIVFFQWWPHWLSKWKHIVNTGLYRYSKDLSNLFLVKDLSNTYIEKQLNKSNIVFSFSSQGDSLRFQNLQECGWNKSPSPTLSPFLSKKGYGRLILKASYYASFTRYNISLRWPQNMSVKFQLIIPLR